MPCRVVGFSDIEPGFAPALTLVCFDLNQSGGIDLPVLMPGHRKPGGKGDGGGRVGFEKDETEAV